MFVERIEKSFALGEPIFASDILSLFPEFTKAYVYRLLKASAASGELIHFSHGVYCLPKKTFFGYSTTSSGEVAKSKYLSDGGRTYGIYSGLSLLNRFAISSQVPNVLEIVTNNESSRKRVVDIGGMKYVLRRSRFEITEDNFCYYVILQLFLEMGSNPVLSDFSRGCIKAYLNENDMDKEQLIRYGMAFPARVLKNLLGSEVLSA